MKKNVFYGSLVGLYVILTLVFIISFFSWDINKDVQAIFSIAKIVLIIFLIMYLLLINFKSKIERKKMKENFWDSPMFDLKAKFTSLQRIFLISSYVIFTIFALVSLGISLFVAGTPEEMDNLYYLTSHGDIIKKISYQEYKVLSLIIHQGDNSIAILVVETALIATKKKKINEV